MPHHRPAQLTELMQHCLLFIYGASRDLTSSEIARRLIFECPPEKARKLLHYSLKAMADAGLIRRIVENARVVRYRKAQPEVPTHVIKDKGRPSAVKFRVARAEVVAPDGSTVTMLETGLLTVGARQVQSGGQYGQHDVKGSANDDEEDAFDSGRCREACGGAGP